MAVLVPDDRLLCFTPLKNIFHVAKWVIFHPREVLPSNDLFMDYGFSMRLLLYPCALTFCMFQLFCQELFSSHFLSQLLSLINTPLSQNPNFYQFHHFLSSTQSKTYTPTTEYIAAEDCKLPCFKSSWLGRVLSGGHMECLVNLSLSPSHSSSCPSPFKLCTIRSWA